MYCFTLVVDSNYFGQLRYARYASYKVFGFIWKSKTITREDSIDCSITPRERKNGADQKRKIEMADRKVVTKQELFFIFGKNLKERGPVLTLRAKEVQYEAFFDIKHTQATFLGL